MPRNISFTLTTRQFLDGSKDVTRRMGWLILKNGDELRAVEKAMGLKKGDKIRALGMIRIASARREKLRRMIDAPAYGRAECIREGFPDLTPAQFVEMFCATHKGCTPDTVVTRIEFTRTEIANR